MDNNLLIGVIDSEEVIDRDQLSDCQSFLINKIGGYPSLSPLLNDETKCYLNSIICDLCQKRLAFVLQIYCPIDDSPNDRLVYVFVCTNSDCIPNKWFVFRTVTPFVPKSDTKQTTSDVWVEGQTHWDNEHMDEELEDKTNDCIESLADLSVECSRGTDDCSSLTVKPTAYFQSFYISVIEEPMDGLRDDKHINQLIESYERNDDKSTKNSNETFEQNFLQTIYKNDRKNHQFFKRLSLCPKQIIRYQWSGQPLVNSDNHQLVVPKCQSCGSDTSFEFQLMPALITYLKPLNSDSRHELDFGTVLIYTCLKNCMKNESLIVEHYIVLSDPDNQFFEKTETLLK